MNHASIRSNLKHFKKKEFGPWWQKMDDRVLQRLDDFREAINQPVIISPAPGALGRILSRSSKSRHNISCWPRVQAADVMLPDGPSIDDKAEWMRLVSTAREVGFGGIGVYLEWKPYPGMHLDVRPVHQDGSPALWTRVGKEYLAIEQAWSNK